MDYKYLAQRKHHWHFHKRMAFHHAVVLTILLLAPLLLVELFAIGDRDAYLQELQLPIAKYVAAQVLAVEDKWLTIEVKPGDNLAKIFSELHIPAKDLHEIVELKHADVLAKLRPKQELRLLLGENHKLEQLEFNFSLRDSLNISRDAEHYQSSVSALDLESHHQFAAGTIKDSLFISAEKAGLPQSIIAELAIIFAWDIDFARDIREGDSFRVLYDSFYLNNHQVRTGNILAAEFINHGKVYTAIRHHDSEGYSGYYTPTGLSLRKAFLRTPVKFTRISSKFDLSRKHPILHTIRAHKGVDYAAATGTPVKSVGAGKITFRGVQGGYGNVVIIKHGIKYTTLYAHLSKFAKGLKVGSKVKQGQTVAYVGSTGMATGPHLHYEFRILGQHYDPVKVQLPKAKPLAKSSKESFLLHAEKLLSEIELRYNSLYAVKS